MNSMSFSLTKTQLLDGSKTVTRRVRWLSLKAGDHVKAVHKCMGLKKGERQTVYGTCEILSVRREPLRNITDRDVAREGFPDKSAQWFIEMFRKAMRVDADTVITRIEFKFTPKAAP